MGAISDQSLGATENASYNASMQMKFRQIVRRANQWENFKNTFWRIVERAELSNEMKKELTGTGWELQNLRVAEHLRDAEVLLTAKVFSRHAI